MGLYRTGEGSHRVEGLLAELLRVELSAQSEWSQGGYIAPGRFLIE